MIMHSGTLTVQNIEKTAFEAMALHKELGVNAVLINTSNLKSVESLIELYDLPRQYDEGGVSRAIRIALVMPETSAARDAMTVYDNVCHNNGWELRPFERRGEALDKCR